MTTTKTVTLLAELVVSAPHQLNPGVVYISKRFGTALHLCCCGCGAEVVTPLNSAGWTYKLKSGKVSLWPSIGNWSLPCQSHYFITDGQVRWAKQMSPLQINIVKQRDTIDQLALVDERNRVKDKVVNKRRNRQSVMAKLMRWFTNKP